MKRCEIQLSKQNVSHEHKQYRHPKECGPDEPFPVTMPMTSAHKQSLPARIAQFLWSLHRCPSATSHICVDVTIGKPQNYPETGLWEALNSTCKALTKVNSLRSNLRLVIALHSPCALREPGLRMCVSEKSRDGDGLYRRLVRSLQSGLSRKNREIRACFAHFGVISGGSSLQFRLRGGGRSLALTFLRQIPC
jgi:hypothetical protein